MGESLRNLQGEAEHRLDKFHAAEVRALAPGAWLTFAGFPGLRLACYGTAARMWTYRYRSPSDKRLRQIRLGRWPAVGWEKAVARWDELRRARDDGVDPQLARRSKRAEAHAKHAAERVAAKRHAVTVEKVVRTFLEEHVAKACRTEKARYDARRMFEGRVLPEIGEKPAHAITRADAADFLARVKIDAPAMARLLRSRLGGAWDHAIDRKLLPHDHANPWRTALRGKLKSKARSRFLDDRELPAFLAKLSSVEDADARDAMHLALLTGARTGEIVGMEWPAIDLERGTWTIGWSKTGLSRTVRLPRQAMAILRARGRGFEITQPALAAALREIKHFGLKHFTPHDIRRTVRTGLSRIGVRDEVAEAALGHFQGGIRGVYNLHAYEREVGKALQTWCDYLDALTAPEVKPLAKRVQLS